MRVYGNREKCYKCYRPKVSCMCKHIIPIETQTKFVILMHPKEFKKVKNGTGFLTHLSLTNSELFIDVEFSKHKRVNEIISQYESFVLYPTDDAINISQNNPKKIQDKKMAIFILDATWSCAKTMLRDSANLQKLQTISFDLGRKSMFEIKEQPEEFCLSTIESTLSVLENIDRLDLENIGNDAKANFLNPFFKMIEYQKQRIEQSLGSFIRYKQR